MKHEFILTVLVVCFVMGCMLRFGELAHGRLLYPYYCPTVSGTSTVGPEHRLFLKLFNNYSSESRPVTNASRPVTVKFAISFNQLLDLVRLPVLLLLLLSPNSSSSSFSYVFLFPSLQFLFLLPLFASSSPFNILFFFRLPLFTSSALFTSFFSSFYIFFCFLHLFPLFYSFFCFLQLLFP